MSIIKKDKSIQISCKYIIKDINIYYQCFVFLMIIANIHLLMFF